MKVTAVTTLSVDRFNYVKAKTDEGLVRTGELHPTLSTPFTILQVLRPKNHQIPI